MWTLGGQPDFPNRGPERRQRGQHGSPQKARNPSEQTTLPGLGEWALLPGGWATRRSQGWSGGVSMTETCLGLFSLLPQALLELGPMKMHVPFQKSEKRSFLRKWDR